MIYTIISIHKNKYKEHNKEALFKIIDDFGVSKFPEYFSDHFYISSVNSVFKYKDFISKEKSFDYQKELKLNKEKTLYSNAFYMILDENKNILDIYELIRDYKKSRNIKDKKKINYFSYWKEKHSTQSYRNSIKRTERNYSFIIQEYINLKECEKIGIKVRKKRMSLFPDLYITAKYDDYMGRKYKNNKTWKNKKIDHQWQK